MITEIWDWIKTIVIAFIIVFLVQMFLFSLAIVSGKSMEPTLLHKEWLFSNKIVYHISSPKLNDIVVLKNPRIADNPDDKYFVKRVVGGPGDHIEIVNGQLVRNGEVVEEAYTDSEIEGQQEIDIVVPEGMYYVMGDNRKLMMSNDSRSFGPVAEATIVGRIDGIIFPFNKFEWY
ncbi:MAG: signal peptidase I [Candidatus Pristimantibacillus lignocellulolyticus]|uniref:Signal peptidase I n=1 Tax=Candidatus Pristimantibacillus lignocellulolyticus TaxID=2994561 RepID=A0A9J6ZGM5_9BACL|nr:MAG: signal peptidase I [Candidatus Pristimantibacillus lignocellulolyticus]